MIPESRLIRGETIIRELSLPEDVKLTKKSLVRWLALSLGLIYPNESRKLLLEVLEALLYFQAKNYQPTTAEIIEYVEKGREKKQHPKAVYYHLLKLKEMGLIERKNKKYTFAESEGRSLPQIFRGFYSSKTERAFKNIEEALTAFEKAIR